MSAGPSWHSSATIDARGLVPDRQANDGRDLVEAFKQASALMCEWGVHVADGKATRRYDVMKMLAPLVGRLIELERQVERQGRDQEALAKLIAPDLEQVREPMAKAPPAAVMAGEPPGLPIARPRWHRPGKR